MGIWDNEQFYYIFYLYQCNLLLYQHNYGTHLKDFLIKSKVLIKYLPIIPYLQLMSIFFVLILHNTNLPYTDPVNGYFLSYYT